jgi:hypothetical protein
VVPGFVRYPPELAYPPQAHTREPAVVLRTSGASRRAWFPGDIERTWWLTGHGDLLRLLHNTIGWLTDDTRIVDVDGPGLIEMFCWETAPGYAIHLLNYSNPDAHHGWLQSTEPLGAQQVTMKLPPGASAKSVALLKAGVTIPHRFEEQVLRFTIPAVDDYEVAAITVA